PSKLPCHGTTHMLCLLELMHNEGLRSEKGNLNSAFITQNQGATEKTLTRLNKDLMSKSQFE
ncbi:MAG: hypothetical protein ACPF9U_02670, partial [Flavobacteriaceae bacterium]